jgi:aminopeptidase N
LYFWFFGCCYYFHHLILLFMRILTYILSAALCCQALGASAQKTALRTDKNLDVQFYHLRLDLPLDKSYLKGEVDCYFATNSGEISLDLHSDFKVSAIKGASTFAHAKNALTISLNAASRMPDGRQKITITYEGVPPIVDDNGLKKGLIYKEIGDDKTPIIASISEPDHAHLWFPCHNVFGDKADSINIDVTIPEKYSTFKDQKGKDQKVPFTVVANGKLVSTLKGEGTRTYQWKHLYPIHPQHVAIAVGDFAKTPSMWQSDETGKQFPISFYVRPADMEQSQGMMNRVPEIMTCLSNTFGTYPYHKEGLKIVNLNGIGTGKYGTVSQSTILMEDMKSIHMYRVVHSMSHMWFGNHISPENWQDDWITEALATYGESVWHEYKRSVRGYLNLLAEKEHFTGGKLYLEKPSDYSETLILNKGIWTIHMLRGILGDQYFYETLKGITEGKRLKKTTISTKDFQQIAEYYASENVTQKYDYFFEQWVFGEMYPSYEVSFENTKKAGVKINIAQKTLTSTPHLFRMPVRLELTLSDGTKQIENIQANAVPLQTLNIMTKLPVNNVVFDYGSRILKKLLFTRHIIDTKNPLFDFSVTPNDSRREFVIQCSALKKQNIKVELIQIADNIEFKEDKIIATQNFPNITGEFKQNFKIPLPLDKRNSYIVKVSGKSDVYSYTMNLLQLENKFEKMDEEK